MTTHSLHLANSSLLALPIAMAFTRQLLLTEKCSSTGKTGSLDEMMECIRLRADTITTVLSKFESYNDDIGKSVAGNFPLLR